MCGSARCYVRQCVRQRASVFGNVLAAVCGSAHGGVRAVIYEPNIRRILLTVTDQYKLLLRSKVI